MSVYVQVVNDRKVPQHDNCQSSTSNLLSEDGLRMVKHGIKPPSSLPPGHWPAQQLKQSLEDHPVHMRRALRLGFAARPVACLFAVEGKITLQRKAPEQKKNKYNENKMYMITKRRCVPDFFL